MAIAKVIIGLAKRANATACMARPRGAAYFDIRFNAKRTQPPGGLEFRGSNSTKRVSVVRPLFQSELA
jgi:hypothetical protein